MDDYKTPIRIAISDIFEYLKKEKVHQVDDNGDVWVYRPSHLINKENQRLNKMLGIHSINKLGNKNGRKRK